MNRTRRSPIDILGITLGVLAILIVIGSIVGIATGRMFDVRSWDAEAFSGAAVREEKDDQVAGDFTEVEVHNVAGSIEISGSSASSGVAIHSVKTAPFPAAAENVRVDIRKQGTRLVVQEKRAGRFLFRTGSISFQIVIPQGVKLVVANSVSGSITVHDVQPGIDQTLSTVSGSIDTSQARNLDASTTSGRIRFAFSGSSLSAKSVSGSIDGQIESLDKSGSALLKTVSGSVTVDAFAGLDATLSLHSLSGHVSCDFPVTISEQRNNRLQGKVGSGAANLDAGTVSGSIAIHKL